MKSFETLEVWKMARKMSERISKLTSTFPGEEKYLLTPQIIRSTRAVHANIAEGYGRFNFKDNIRFCRIARGSLYETLDHLITAKSENYINDKMYDEMKEQIEHLMKLLNGYILYLKNRDVKN